MNERTLFIDIPIDFEYQDKKNGPVKRVNRPLPWQSMRTGRTGGKWKPKRILAYYAHLKSEVLAGLPLGWVPIEGPVSVGVVKFYFPRPRYHYSNKKGQKHIVKAQYEDIYWMSKTPDIDNLLKPLWDSLEGIIFVNDCQIVNYDSLSKAYITDTRECKENGYIMLAMSEL